MADRESLALSINNQLESDLSRLFGFSAFRTGQQRVIEHILRGESVLAAMPTGAGKSLCYQLPAMLLDGITIVVSPLIALMKDQVDGLPSAVQEHATLINSSLEGDEIERRLREIKSGKYKLIYTAPERLRQRPFLHALISRGVSLVVIDEAHCVSMWGHDFRPDYLFIGDALDYLQCHSVLAMTATATPDMRLEIANSLRRNLNVVSTGTHRPNLFLESIVLRSDENKMRELIRLCREIDGPGIVYVRSRQKAEELAIFLRRERIEATFYHAGLSPEDRTRTQDEFMDGRWRIVVATIAFGMGIDKSDVRFVVHYSPPQSLESYYQEAGRAGRDGYPARCVLLCTPNDKASTERWTREELIGIEIPRGCYRILRDMTRDSRFATVRVDEFSHMLGTNETRMRVAINMLEEVGLARRHFDIPSAASISLTSKGNSSGDAEFLQFSHNAGLRLNCRIQFEMLDLSNRSQIPPYQLEENLLNWREAGWISCFGSGRLMLLERLAAPKDSRKLLDNLLERFSKASQERIAAIFDYAETKNCRHDTIAEHFGDSTIENCKSCENCLPQTQPYEKGQLAASTIAILDDEKNRIAILKTVAMIEGNVGFTGLVRMLKGVTSRSMHPDLCRNFGILSHLPKTAIERLVQEMLRKDLIERDDSEYRLIYLTEKGREEIE